MFERGLRTRSVSKTQQILPVYIRNWTSQFNSPAGPAVTAVDRAAGDDRRCSWHHRDVKLAANPSSNCSIPVKSQGSRLPNGETIDVEDRIRLLIELGKQAFLI